MLIDVILPIALPDLDHRHSRCELNPEILGMVGIGLRHGEVLALEPVIPFYQLRHHRSNIHRCVILAAWRPGGDDLRNSLDATASVRLRHDDKGGPVAPFW